VANLSSGGRVEPYRTLINHLLHGNTERISAMDSTMRHFCTAVAEVLAESACFGEFGMDLGLAPNDCLWLIEVNSKPRKTTETAMSRSIVRNTFRYPLAYASFLSGFPAP
jgi:hypothetical protein